MGGELLLDNLTSPMILAFALGMLATAVRSDLTFPAALTSGLTTYLLFAIGWKGGRALAESSPGEIWLPALVTLALGVTTPVVAFVVLRALGFVRVDAAAIAAHYGSVSAVTFAAGLTFLAARGDDPEGFMATLLALLEVPGIVVALALAGARQGTRLTSVVREALAGRGIVLLVGGLAVGALASDTGAAQVAPFFEGLFFGVLTIFLLDLGMIAMRRLGDLRGGGLRLVGFALCTPLVFGAAGVALGTAAGLSVGGAALLGTMAASASYIAATAAVRESLPEASPALYLTASLGITFPLNLTLGIPAYAALASALG